MSCSMFRLRVLRVICASCNGRVCRQTLPSFGRVVVVKILRAGVLSEIQGLCCGWSSSGPSGSARWRKDNGGAHHTQVAYASHKVLQSRGNCARACGALFDMLTVFSAFVASPGHPNLVGVLERIGTATEELPIGTPWPRGVPALSPAGRAETRDCRCTEYWSKRQAFTGKPSSDKPAGRLGKVVFRERSESRGCGGGA